jgi:RimJ/RimL family protein N-acetyltransferase
MKLFHDAILGVMICLQAETQPRDEKVRPSEAESLKSTPIGHLCFFTKLGPETYQHRNMTLGISLAPEFRGKGYGGEAINWGLDWAFLYAGAHRVCLSAFSYNGLALQLYKRLGFVEEGREREAVYYLREWHDIVNLSMLEHEWEKLHGAEKS